MTTYKIWLLRLILPTRYGRLLTGLLIFAVLYPVFTIGTTSSDDGPALFFSLIIAYIIPMFSLITDKVKEALLELRPILDLSTDEFNLASSNLDSASLIAIMLKILIGVAMGFAHLSLIVGSPGEVILGLQQNVANLFTALGTLSVWVVMTTVTSMLIRQAVLFARLGRHNTQISLLNKRRLLPFARVSIISSLAIIGALALFPVMSLDDGLKFEEGLPGAIATLGPLMAIFIIPVWPVHRRLAAMKEQELQMLDQQIGERLDDGGTISHDAESLARITPILNYRKDIAAISTWPFDGGAITRMAFYLIIPPLTWAGAALIEKLVELML